MRTGLAIGTLLVATMPVVAAGQSSSPAAVPVEGSVVIRPADGAIDAILASADGDERILRHVTADDLGLGPEYRLELSGHVSPSGWLEVNGIGQPWRTAFVDLADPARPPIVVPGNGFVGVRWGPDGRAALVCGRAPDCGQVTAAAADRPSVAVRVLDLETGSETIVQGVQLHGGNPEPIWAEDGSGFLFRFEDGGWGVTPLDGGPVVAGTPTIISRRFRLEPPSTGAAVELTEADTVGRRWLGDLLAPAVPVTALDSADRDAVWVLLDEARGSQHQAVLAKLTAPGEIASLQRFDVPRPVVGFGLSDDDTLVALDLGRDAPWPFVLARVGDKATTATSRVIDGLRLRVLPADEAEGWPSGR